MRYAWILALFLAPAAHADGGFGADVLFLGEVHDNPAHHLKQAEIITQVVPKAVVWEMLTPDQAARVTPDAQDLGDLLQWEESGWPDFAIYAPVFDAANEATHYGAAIPRDQARAVMQTPIAEVFGADAAQFGLDQALSEDQQTAREAMQMAAHCDALPAEMLPMMVDIQRLRDAELARQALKAHTDTGGPVVVITGNGHARMDWGAPAALTLAAPDLHIYALGQGEAGRGAPDGVFNALKEAAPVDRGDPCEAFK
ncbi:ChaN family lipoprotein [Tropicibacter naphthalenivorans]|uniref:Putative iron-regulated protein n=1 Tax=Tropicibacter naphthalenivorans TaxID=441103 RepID=A0A0P1GB46_9RHOB|nr:ChaN family lipoprotein [Tropicibacter naphthalenivorans]CUH78675.1 putative iron-regulated protein [Tropicibacter naphthalenivorans]SMC81196.1 Haem-binding uptake, Tiki superfamily, ChaN [Tropicibacter naphthalenivorans]